MAFELIMDVDDEDINQKWMEGVTRASRTEAEEIEQQLIEEAKRASLAEAREQEYQEESPTATSQDSGSRKSVRFLSTQRHDTTSPTMALRLVGTHQGPHFTNGATDNDSTPPSSESDGNEANSEPDASTEEGLSPAGRQNINGTNSGGPITSLPLVEWPDEVRQQMLISMLVKDEPIIPYYHQGSVEGTSEETKKPNYDIKMLLATAGEPQLYQQALEIFYSKNIWEFENPRVAQWWLKKLGAKVALLRHINIDLTQGVWGIGSTPLEKLWYMLIVWMKPRVKLYTIKVSFEQWDHALVRNRNVPPTEFFPVAESRLGVWSTLLSFRGLNSTDISAGPFVPYDYADALARTMILPENQADAEAECLKRRWHKQVYPDT